ncbi:MAG TPA: hypothetical protein VGM23_01930, partial [Armatimonadota bacterium]
GTGFFFGQGFGGAGNIGQFRAGPNATVDATFHWLNSAAVQKYSIPAPLTYDGAVIRQQHFYGHRAYFVDGQLYLATYDDDLNGGSFGASMVGLVTPFDANRMVTNNILTVRSSSNAAAAATMKNVIIGLLP